MVTFPALQPQEARQKARLAADALSRDARVRLIFLFGSAVDESRTAVRDVDLAILTEPAVSFEERLELQSAAERAAGIDLDLVLLHEASVVLGREVASTGLCLYEASEGLETEWRVRAQLAYLDFKPYLERTRRYLREYNEELLRDAST